MVHRLRLLDKRRRLVAGLTNRVDGRVLVLTIVVGVVLFVVHFWLEEGSVRSWHPSRWALKVVILGLVCVLFLNGQQGSRVQSWMKRQRIDQTAAQILLLLLICVHHWRLLLHLLFVYKPEVFFYFADLLWYHLVATFEWENHRIFLSFCLIFRTYLSYICSMYNISWRRRIRLENLIHTTTIRRQLNFFIMVQIWRMKPLALVDLDLFSSQTLSSFFAWEIFRFHAMVAMF